MQEETTCLLGSPGFFRPCQLIWRRERGLVKSVLHVLSTWCERKGISVPKGGLYEPEVIKTAGKVFIPSGRREKKQEGREPFPQLSSGTSPHLSLQPGPALTFHPSQDQPSPFTPARTSPHPSLQLRSLCSCHFNPANAEFNAGALGKTCND